MKKIGKYEIREELGRGGMGVVYRAYDSMIDREVAIKVISELALEHAEIKERFYREARTAGRLSHDNITVVYDVGESEGKPYIVMEYLTGRDLRSLLDLGEVSLEDRLDCAYQVCKALAYSHSKDIIHRDIKPGNVRILDDGKIKIMDFGIAKPMSSNLTSTGQVMGTPFYMSPEQIRGLKVDKRSDMFSFGVLFYEMLTNRLPFPGDQPMSVMFKIVHDEPEDLGEVDPRFTNSLKSIVHKALQKKPDDRYQFFDEVAGDIEGILHELRKDERDRQAQNKAKAIKLFQESESLFKKNSLQRASEIANRAKSLDPRNSQIHKLIGQIQEAEKKEAQRKLLEEKLAEAREHLQQSEFDLSLKSIGDALRAVPDSQNALAMQKKVEDARRLHEENLQVAKLMAKGRESLSRNEYDDALRSAEDILQIRPKDGVALKLQEEITTAKKAAYAFQAKRSKVDLLWKEGTELFNNKDYRNAAIKLKELVELSPENLQAWKLLEIAQTEAEGAATRIVPQGPESGSTVLMDRPFGETKPFDQFEQKKHVPKVDAPPKKPVHREKKSKGKGVYVLLAVIGLLIGGVIGYQLLVPGTAVPMGSVSINALPWAEVSKIEGENGGEVEIEKNLMTPCRLSLPAGRYKIHLSNPDYRAALVLSVTVYESQHAVLKETMPGFDAEQILSTF